MTTEATTDKQMQHIRTLLDDGRLEEALSAVDLAFVRGVPHADAYCLKAGVLLALERWDEALECACRASEIRPMEGWPYRLCSLALQQAGDWEAAHPAAKVAAELERYHPETVYTLWSCLWALRDLPAARMAALHLRQTAPHSPLTHEALGRMALDQDRSAEAERYFRRALELKPDAREALYGLGTCLENLGRQEEARAFFQRALCARPSFDLTGQGSPRPPRFTNEQGGALTIAVIFLMLLAIPRVINTSNCLLVGPTIWIVASTCAILTVREKPPVLERIAAVRRRQEVREARRRALLPLRGLAPYCGGAAALLAAGCASALFRAPGTDYWWSVLGLLVVALCIAGGSAWVWRQTADVREPCR